jgi:hypothetical protein
VDGGGCVRAEGTHELVCVLAGLAGIEGDEDVVAQHRLGSTTGGTRVASNGRWCTRKDNCSPSFFMAICSGSGS